MRKEGLSMIRKIVLLFLVEISISLLKSYTVCRLSGVIANEMLKDEATESIVLKAVEMYNGVKNKKRNEN